MYKFIARQVTRGVYAKINRGDWQAIMKSFDPHVHFMFVGQHALAVDCDNPEPIKSFFRRTFELIPDFHLEPKTILVNGPPWSMWVATHFTARGTLGGAPYANHGIQLLHLRWGKIIEDFIYEDSQLLAQRLEQLDTPLAPVQAA